MQPRPGQRPRALARSAARRAGLALDNAARAGRLERARVAASRHEAAATPEALKVEAGAEADLEGLAVSLAAGHLTRRELPRWRAGCG